MKESNMHEITGRDNVLLMEGHPLSGMGNWHGLAETQRWDSDIRKGLDGDDVRRVLGVGDWEVKSVPLADARTNPPTLIEGHIGIACGDNPPHYFPSKAYGILQNESLIDLAGVFREAARSERGVDLPILSAGTLRDRRMAFVSVGVPDDAALDGLPARSHALNLGTSHDGTCALVGCLASYIVVCANTFRASLLGTAPQEVRVKHTSAIEDLEAARMILRDMVSAATATDRAIARLLDTSYPAHNFHDDLTQVVLPQLYASPPEGEGWTGAHTRQENRVEAIWSQYHGDNVPAAHRDTAWGALMAVQGWEQHDKATRTTAGKAARHGAALAIQRTVAGTTGGYPLSDALLHTGLPGLAASRGIGVSPATLADLVAA